MTDLTPKQKLFCLEYLKDFNATQAAIRAGYGKKGAHTIGSNLLKKKEVADELARKARKITKKAELTVDSVIQELKSIAFSKISDFIVWDADNAYFKSMDDIETDKLGIISEINSSNVKTKDGDNVTHNMKIKLHDKMRSLEMLGRYLNLFKENIEVTGNLTIEELVRQKKEGKK